MDDAAGNLATQRTHPPEQSGYVISGKILDDRKRQIV